MITRAVTLRLLAVVLVAGVALTAAPAPAATPAEKRYANKVVRIVNDIRADNGRVKLDKNRCLKRFATKQATKMANQRRLSHQDLGKIQQACGVGLVGENVAYGPFGPKDIVDLWMKSAGHRANILHRPYRLTGVGVSKAGGHWWVAQVFGRKG